MKNIRVFFISRKTSIAGMLTVLGAVFSAIGLMMDGDPVTNPDWMAVAAAVIAGLGLIFARDADKSSQESGIRK